MLKDWAFAHAAVEDLQAYLLSRELFWPLSLLPEERAAGQLLTLTPGNLLLSLKKLAATAWKGEQQIQAGDLFQQVDAARRQWRSAWLQKAQREFAARIKLWQDYLADSVSEGGRLVDYPFQARWRTILDLLVEDGARVTPVQSGLIAGMDEQLKLLTIEAPFVWERDVESGFPPMSFWYLYRAQRKP